MQDLQGGWRGRWAWRSLAASSLRRSRSSALRSRPSRASSRFLSPYEVTGATDDHLYEFWANYLVTTVGSVTSSGPYRAYNSFYLVDRWNNVTFGYSGTQTVSTPQNINVSFTSQLTGSSVPDVSYPGYETDVSWSNIGGAMPSGTYGLNLALNFTDAQYGSGTVTQPITLSFISGTHSALVSQQDYDLRFGVNDTGWPVTVPPAATGSALPATSDPRSGQPSIPKRLCFQIVTGTNVPYSGEIYENPHNVYDALGNYVRTDTNQDPHLETSEPGRMKLSVVDGTNTPMTDIAFQVHNCPHYDHEGSPRQPTDMTNARTCADTPVQSAGGVIASYSVNPAGSSRGYMGIELLRAPTNPGNYYIKIESLDQIYRIEQLPGLTVDPMPRGEFKGAFALCVVQSPELLDENFTPVTATLNMSIDRAVYVREVDSAQAADTYQADVILKNDDTDVETGLQNVNFRRLGKSSVFLTDLISIVSPDPPPSMLAATPLRSVATHWSYFMARQALVGPIAPSSGRYTVLERRIRSGSTATTKLQKALTRLVEITDATPNFDGVTSGRDRITATAQLGANGWVSTKLFNVDDDAVFTFDTWINASGQTLNLTSDLRTMGGLPLGSAQNGVTGDTRTFPASGLFQSILPQGHPEAGQTVKPGLYRLRAKWALNQSSAESTIGDPICVTDKPQFDVCDNEWVVSVGQRIFLDIEGALENLGADLTNVQVSYPPAARLSVASFVDTATARINALFAEAGANVLVTTTQPPLRPYLRHMVRPTMASSTCDNGTLPPIFYGCTTGATFPLVDADLDLAPSGDAGAGIRLEAIYSGPAWSYDPAHPGDPSYHGSVENHLPSQSSDPQEIFLRRFVNISAHEITHGFGLMASRPYSRHGRPSTTNYVIAIDRLNAPGVYAEVPGDLTLSRLHEPITCQFGFGFSDITDSNPSNRWLMQLQPARWLGGNPLSGGAYAADQWLVFDKPLRFSLASDFQGYRCGSSTVLWGDYSLESFFKERVPMCGGTRTCR